VNAPKENRNSAPPVRPAGPVRRPTTGCHVSGVREPSISTKPGASPG